MDIRNHGIVGVIEQVLGSPWAPSVEVGREVPEPKSEVDCVVSPSNLIKVLTLRHMVVQECYSWEFGGFPTKLMNSNSSCELAGQGD